MDWRECINKRIVKEIGSDEDLIESLIRTTENKIEIQNTIDMNEKSASVKVTLMYDAVRELLEALAIKNGFKLYNYECYCAFLKEIVEESELGAEFDSFRRIRNSINYYGEAISVSEAEDLIGKMILFANKIKELLG